jgi:hypothetical protein
MRQPTLTLGFLLLVLSACQDRITPPDVESIGARMNRVPDMQFAEEIFIDGVANPSHAGPGPHPDTESVRYSLIQGGVRWFPGEAVEYRLAGAEPTAGGNDALEAAVGTWDSFISTRSFNRNDATTQLNPCSGQPNVIEWGEIDGEGGTAAFASVCRNPATKEIAGFLIRFDSEEPWSTTGAAAALDVEGVASHEFGHAAGLGHVNSARDGCLTMYYLVALGETQKRTLGLGDKLGMHVLYGSADISAGSCGT